MICPQTKAKCGHLAYCDITGGCMDREVAAMDKIDAEVRGAISLAEIERLVDALVDAAIYSDVPDAQEARAALMAAIRLYVQE